MYPDLIKPVVDYNNAQIQTLSRFAQSRDVVELTRSSVENFWKLVQENQSRFVQSDALKELAKANIENFSRFIEQYVRSFSALAYEAQGQFTRGIQEGSKRFQQVANAASSIAGTAADETAEMLKSSAEEVADEADDVAKARGRRRG